MLTRLQVNTDINSNVYTNTLELVKGDTVRDRLLVISNNSLNIVTDAGQPGGYVNIDGAGAVNVACIKAGTPAGLFLKDNGTWATLGATWASITGNIEDNVDLSAALDARFLLSDVDYDILLTANSDSKVASQKAVKTYIGNLVVNYEPIIGIGTTGQYWRGDKTWQPFTWKAALTNDPGTNGANPIISNGDALLVGTAGNGRLYYDGTRTILADSSLLYINSAGTVDIEATTKIKINAPSVEFSQLTASRLPWLDGSKYIKSSTIQADGSNLFFTTGNGIDAVATGGTDVLNIGGNNADVINIGGTATTINIIGNVTNYQAIQSTVADQLITINKGGPAGSAGSTGFEIEENAIITGYFKTTAARDGFAFKAPGIAYKLTLDFAALVTADRILTAPNNSGTIALTSDLTGAISGNLNYVPKFTGINSIGNSLIFDDGTNIGIGLAAPSARLHVKSTGITNSTTAFIVQDSAGNSAIEVWDDGRVAFNRTGYGFGSSAALNSNITNASNFAWNWEIYNTRTTGNPVGMYIAIDGATSGTSTALKLNVTNAATNIALEVDAGHVYIAAGSNNLSLGTSSVTTNYKFEVKGIDATSANYAFVAQSSTSYLITARNDGFVGIGCAAPTSTEMFRVAGNVYFNTVLNGTWNGAPIGVTYGGTNFTAYTVGDFLYADTTTTLAKRAAVTTGSVLGSAGTNTAPAYLAVSNGLTATATTFKLGGALTATTNITGAQTLSLGTTGSRLSNLIGYSTTLTALYAGSSASAGTYGALFAYGAANSYITGFQSTDGTDIVSVEATKTTLQVLLTGSNAIIGINSAGATVTNNGTNNVFVVTDTGASKGIVYAADYSANFTNESLVSKRWVQNNTLSTTLTATHIFVGNGSNVATDVALTLNGTGGTFALSNAGVITFPNANTSTRGLLLAADWNTFNGKQDALSGTGFVKISGTTISYDNSTYLTTSSAASSYQPLDSDLTTIAGLTTTTDNFIVSVAGAWASRTPAQVKTTLSLNNVENTALSTGNAATATALQTARTINGVSFDGTANINTMNYGLSYSNARGCLTV